MAKIFLFVAFVLVAGGIAYLALSDVPAPVKTVEKPISTERFLQK
jgi:hypothetical protein